MCTGIVETTKVQGSAKGPNGWFRLGHANVSYDHPTDAQLEHSLNIDFVNMDGGGSRVAVELSADSARRLIDAIMIALKRAETSLA